MSTLEHFGMLNMPKCSKVDISWNYNIISQYGNYTVQLWTLQNYKMLMYNYLHTYKVISVGMQHWYAFSTLMQRIPNIDAKYTKLIHTSNRCNTYQSWCNIYSMLMQHLPKVGATSAYTGETSFQHWCQVIHAVALTLLHSEKPKLHTILAFLSAIGLMLDQFCQNVTCPLGSRKYI